MDVQNMRRPFHIHITNSIGDKQPNVFCKIEVACAGPNTHVRAEIGGCAAITNVISGDVVRVRRDQFAAQIVGARMQEIPPIDRVITARNQSEDYCERK